MKKKELLQKIQWLEMEINTLKNRISRLEGNIYYVNRESDGTGVKPPFIVTCGTDYKSNCKNQMQLYS